MARDVGADRREGSDRQQSSQQHSGNRWGEDMDQQKLFGPILINIYSWSLRRRTF